MAVLPFTTPRILQGSAAQRLRSRDSARLAQYRELWDFYSGRHFRTQRRGRTNLVANYARAIVDKGLGYLFARGIKFSIETNQVAEDSLASSVRDAHLLRVLLQAGVNASVLGDAILKVFVSADQLRVVNLDPSNVFPTWAGDDPEELRSISVISSLSAAEAAERYGVQTAKTAELLETWTPARFELRLNNQVVVDGPNPYGFIPFVHIANLAPPGSPWGQSDLVDLVPLNRELDERMSDQADLIRYHADPPVVFKGVEEHSDLPVGPGTVWDLPKDADVSLLEWRGQVPAIDTHLARVMTALHDLSESPRTTFGETSQAFSGVALEAQSQPIVQRTLRKRIVWEPALERVAEYLLRLAELAGLAERGAYAPYRAEVLWAPMLPRDDAADANRELALVAGGLKAPTTAMAELGELDTESELTRTIAQRERLGLNAATPAERGTRFASP